MKGFIAKLFFMIPKDQTEVYERKRIAQNMSRSLIMAWLIFSIEVIILMITFMPSISVGYEAYLNIYRYLYIVMIIYSGLYLLLNYMGKQYLKQHSHLMEFILLFSSVLFLVYSALITLYDQYRQIESFVFIFISMALAIVFVSKPINSLIYYTLSWGFYVIGNFLIGIEGTQLFSNILNTTTVIITAWIISVTLYNSHARSHLKNVIIHQQKLELERMVLLDPMTGLYNRRGLSEALVDCYDKALQNQENITAFMIDIDYFKGFNDSYGHDKGDYVIKVVAEEMIKIAESYSGIACRYGGDEMCLVMSGIDLDMSNYVSREIGQRILNRKMPNQASLINEYVTISCGHYMSAAKAINEPWQLITEADDRLYAIKRARTESRLL